MAHYFELFQLLWEARCVETTLYHKIMAVKLFQLPSSAMLLRLQVQFLFLKENGSIVQTTLVDTYMNIELTSPKQENCLLLQHKRSFATYV